MKRIFFILIATILVFPMIGFAEIKEGQIPDATDLNINPSPVGSVSQGVDILSSVVGWVYAVFFILTVLFIILAAYKYLTQADDAEKIKEARQQLIYAAIAVVIALLAVGFSAIIDNFLKNPNPPVDNYLNGAQGGPLSPDYPI